MQLETLLTPPGLFFLKPQIAILLFLLHRDSSYRLKRIGMREKMLLVSDHNI